MRGAAAAVSFLVFFAMLAGMPAYGGIVEVDGYGNTTLVSEGRLKYTPRSEQGQQVIFDANTGDMIQVDSAKRIYAEGGADEYCEAARLKVKSILEGLSPEERHMLEDAEEMPEISIERSGEGETVAGFDTVIYRVMAGGRLYAELWLSEAPALMEEMKHFQTDWKRKFEGCVAGAYGLAGVPSVESSPEYLELRAKGWEMKSLLYEAGIPVGGAVVESIEEKDIPETEFQPPEGFKRVSMQEMMGVGQ